MSANFVTIRNENRWYRLDNAAKIYPAVRKSSRESVFRVSAQMTEAVDPDILQRAVTATLPRFPSFNVRIRKGLFWYYFEHNPDELVVTPEKAPVCRPIRVEENHGYLLRVCYYRHRISLEVFHAVADGTGACAFLKALLYRYLSLQGKPIADDEEPADANRVPSVAEVEDSFLKFYDENAKKDRTEQRAYQIRGTGIPREYVRLTQGIVPADALKSLSKAVGATVTEYLVALLIWSVYDTQLSGRGDELPVKVSVPVNLRRFFPSKTLRNFSSYINVGMRFSEGDYTFEEVLAAVRINLAGDMKKEKFVEKISANVAAELNPFMRLTPLVMKNIALRTAYNRYGERLVTSTLSNLGVVTLPESMGAYVSRFDFILGPPVKNMLCCAVCTFGGRAVISFSSVMEEADIDRFYFRHLAREGLDVVIETNYGVSL
jgi:NRPS condensation-like uncharacterized protein